MPTHSSQALSTPFLNFEFRTGWRFKECIVDKAPDAAQPLPSHARPRLTQAHDYRRIEFVHANFSTRNIRAPAGPVRYSVMSQRSPSPVFMLTLVSITLVGTMSIHLFLPVMPEVKKAFDASDALVGATFSLALLVMACSTLFYGSLSDRYGRRPVLIAGLALFCLGSLAAALAASVEALLVGRVVQALGAGCGVTLSRAIARDRYGNGNLVAVISYLTMASTLGPTFSPLIGGLLVDSLGWRSVLWFTLLGGSLILAAAWRVLAESHSQESRAEHSHDVVRNYAALLSNPAFVGFVLATAFSSATFFSVASALTFLMKDYLGRSSTEYGLWFMLFPSAYALGNYLANRLASRISVETQILTGAVIMAALVAGQAAIMLAGHITPLTLAFPWCLISVAQGMITPNAQAGALRIKPHLAGTAAGITMFAHFALSAVFVQFYTVLADGTPVPMVICMSVGTALTVAFSALPFALKRRGR
ncbi:MAG: Bcr/CflA family efflux MFS transporter [Betaproteobacteria bacterium]|nr:Bcr/CflA family efflux MFS transporter [Betaproteobacteria bacterium]